MIVYYNRGDLEAAVEAAAKKYRLTGDLNDLKTWAKADTALFKDIKSFGADIPKKCKALALEKAEATLHLISLLEEADNPSKDADKAEILAAKGRCDQINEKFELCFEKHN